jgi:hypothetical protein
MGYYEPQWSAEEQTMVDLMKLAGYGVVPDINRDRTTIHLHLPHTGAPLLFTADTEYEAIRKCFSAWDKHHAQVI